jgi:hypothetical protein
LFRVNEASSAPLNFKFENITDQFMSCDYECMFINENYLRLYSFNHPHYNKLFEDKQDWMLVTSKLEEILQAPPYI